MDMFSTRALVRALEQTFPIKTFLRDLVVKSTDTLDTDTVDIDIVKGKRRAAAYVSPVIEGKVVKQQGFKTMTVKFPYTKEKIPTTAEMLLKRRPGENIYSATTPLQRAQKKLAEDLNILDTRVSRAEELQIVQAMTTGKLAIKGDGIQLDIDFGMSADHLPVLAGTSAWDNAAAVPLDNLDSWIDIIARDSGLSNCSVVMGAKAAAAFMKRVGTKENFDLLRFDIGRIDPVDNIAGNGATFIGVLKWPQCRVYKYQEYYSETDDANGNEVVKPMFPENGVLIVSNDLDTRMMHGVIKDMEAGQSADAPIAYAVRRFAKSWVEKDPSVRWLLMQSSPLFVPVQVDGFVFATVMA